MKVGVACWSLTAVVYVFGIYDELEGPRDMKIGTWIINDMQMLLKKFDPIRPNGGAVTWRVNFKWLSPPRYECC